MIQKLLTLLLVAFAVRAACIYAVRYGQDRASGAWLQGIHRQENLTRARRKTACQVPELLNHDA